ASRLAQRARSRPPSPIAPTTRHTSTPQGSGQGPAPHGPFPQHSPLSPGPRAFGPPHRGRMLSRKSIAPRAPALGASPGFLGIKVLLMTQHIARLIELRDDEHEGVRRLVADALSSLAKELWKALPALLRMLRDDDPAVQTAAHETLRALAPWGGGRAGGDARFWRRGD